MSNQASQLELWEGAYAGPQKPLYTYRRTLGGKRVLVPGSARLKGDRKCRECGRFERKRLHGRTYFKCDLIGDTNGPGTDKRLSDPACEMFIEAEGKGPKVDMPGAPEPMTEAERAEAARQIGAAVGARVEVMELGEKNAERAG